MSEAKTKKRTIPFNLQVKMNNFLPATDEDKKYIVKMRKPSTYMKDAMKRLWANRIATVSAFIIIAIALSVIFIPIF